MRPNVIKITLSSVLIYVLSFFGSAYSAEINIRFSGTANHTVSSGVSVRVSDYDCDLYTGYTYTESGVSVGLTTTTRGNGQGCTFTDSTPALTLKYSN